jgi:cation:H+ antiporter
MQWIYLFIGLAGMLVGAKWLVDGCVRLSRRFGFSEFVVSVIIIGIGTCLPELFVSFISGARDLGTLVISNNVGSNIINIWGILGIGALISPIALSGRRHLAELIFLGGASIVAAVMIWTGTIGRVEGLILFAILFAYLWYARIEWKGQAPKEIRPGVAAGIADSRFVWKILLLIIIGILALYAGSELFMDALETIAAANNLDQTMMGILIVAPGTAVPELLVTIIAAFRRKPEIAVGNIIGSNFMNIVLVIATGAVIIDLPVTAAISNFHIWVMLAATAMLCFDLLYWQKLSRAKGVLYLMLLAAYLSAAVFLT